MDEVSLAESLRSLNCSDEPDPGFREDLFAMLQAENDVTVGPVATFPDPAADEEAPLQARPDTPGRSWSWQWAAVAFVVVGVLGLLTYLSLPGPDELINPTQESTVPGPGTTAAILDGRLALNSDQVRLPEEMHPLEVTADGSQIAFLVSSELQSADKPPLEESELIVAHRSTGDIVLRTPLGDAPNRLALDESGIWVTHFDTGSVTLVDRSTGEITAEIVLELPFDFGGQERDFLPNDIVVGGETVWVSTARGAIASIDKSSLRVRYLTDFGSEVPGAGVQGPSYVSEMALLDGILWIALDLGGVTRLDPATGAITNVGLGVLDHGADQISVVDGAVYAEGNRLERNGEGDLVLDGSYVASDESALTLLDASSGQPQASAVIDGTILFVGDVGGNFGAVSDRGLLHRLDTGLAAQGEPAAINLDSSARLVSLDGEAWTMDSPASQLLRVQPTGQVGPETTSVGVRWSTAGVGMIDAFFPDNRLLAANQQAVFVADGWGDASNDPRGVSALSVTTGDVIWHRSELGTIPSDSGVFIQLLTPDRLVVNGQDRLLAALDLTTGDTLWAFNLPEGYHASGAVSSGDLMYVGAHATSEGAIQPPIAYAVDLSDGSVVWETPLTEGTDLQPAAPALAEDSILFGTTLSHPGSAEGNMIHAVSLEDGSILWDLNLGGDQGFKFFPTLIRDQIAIVSGPTGMLGVSLNDGTIRWEVPAAQPLLQTAAGLALGQTQQGIAAFSWETGEATTLAQVDWAQDVYRPNTGLIVKGQLVVSDGRTLRAFASTGGELLWSWEAPGVIVDAPILVGEAITVPVGNQAAASPDDRHVLVLEVP